MTPQYNMFLDDERFPPKLKDWVIIRSYQDAKDLFNRKGCPIYISFDHDLGYNQKTGKDVANLMIEMDMDTNQQFIPHDFLFTVHSQNPVGAKNIENLLNQYLEWRFNR